MRKDTGRAASPLFLEKLLAANIFILFVNNFCVECVGKEHATPLITTLNENYIISK